MSTARTGGNNNNNSPQTTFNNLADNNNTGSLPRMCINKNDISSDKHQQVGAVLSGAASVGRWGNFLTFFLNYFFFNFLKIFLFF